MANREVINTYLFNAQAIYSKGLFEPETKDLKGKPLDKPSYSINLRFPKTKSAWYEEPQLKPLVDAFKTIMAREMAGIAFGRIEFPIKDGDVPNQNNKIPDWAKGHWHFRASSSYGPKVEQRVNGVVTELPALSMGGRRLWGDGDYVCAAIGVAKRLTDAVGIRAYLNSILFTAKGPELNLGASNTDWNEAMRMAEEQGIPIKTDEPGAGGFPGGGFDPSAGAGGFPGGGFNPGAAPGGFPGGGFNPGAGAAPGGFPGAAPGGFPGGAATEDKPPF